MKPETTALCQLTSGFLYSCDGMDLHAELAAKNIPEAVAHALTVVEVPYLDFAGTDQTGELIVHQELAGEIVELFQELKTLRFPIERIVPLSHYEWDDNASMEDNNTSAFNYRPIAGTDRLSNHSFGRAIDINPRLNPYHAYDGKVYPTGATYDPSVPGTIGEREARLFEARGWSWGGRWHDVRDYQHMEKP